MSGSGFKKFALGTLAVLLIAIWIRNLLLFVPATETDKMPEPQDLSAGAAMVTTEPQRDTAFILDPAVRDPFSLPNEPSPIKAAHAPTTQSRPPAESLHASLMGHVFNARQPCIVALDSLTGRARLFHAGDSLNGFVLSKIARSEIHWKSQKGRRIVWKISP